MSDISKYYGPAHRAIKTRCKEHLVRIKYGRTEKYSIAYDIIENSQLIDINKLNLFKQVTNYGEVNSYKSTFICNIITKLE